MTKTAKRNLKIGVGVVVIGLGAWYIYSKYYAAPAAAPAATPSTGATPIPLTTAAMVSSGAPTMTNSNGVSLGPTLYNWVTAQHPTSWSAAFFSNVFPQWTSADVANLAALYDQFIVNGTVLPSLQGFWNQWFPGGDPLGYST
jgi:hypothetical protein